QITGVEGYVESAATGIRAGINAARLVRGEEPLELPAETAIGSLCRYITSATPDHFQPMNITFSLLPPPEHRIRDPRQRTLHLSRRTLQALDAFIRQHLAASGTAAAAQPPGPVSSR